MNDLKFSIIIAVYNVEKYIKETIESVINQTMDFEKNIEIILVDDGSTDNSAVICKEYAKKYSDNIKYLYQKNAGASAARNAGIKIARGKYYNFLDSDDLLHEAALEKVYEFFKKHEEVDMVTLPIECIERQQGLYQRYIKFGNISKVIDLEASPQDYVFSSAASFYKAEVFADTKFNTNLKLAEDLFFNTTLYLRNHKFGFISPNEAVYYYRKRYSNNSITNVNEYAEDWLVDILGYVYKGLLKESKKKYKKIPEFLQYIFIYNIVKRLDTPNFVSKNSLNDFYTICEEMMSYVDEDIIISYNYSSYYMLAMMLMFKSKDYDIKKIIYMDSKNNICIKGKTIENVANYNLQISSLKFVDNKLVINGYFNDILVDDFRLLCYHQENQTLASELKLETTNNIFLQKRFFDKVIGKTYFVTGEIPIDKGTKTYYIALSVNNSTLPIQIKNIYGDDGILVNQSYDTELGKCILQVNNQFIITSLESNEQKVEEKEETKKEKAKKEESEQQEIKLDK